MAAVLVTLTQAKAHLRITTPALDAGDADIQIKLDQAEAAILDRCRTTPHWAPIVAAWTDATVPRSVQAAILILLGNLYENRGDDEAFGMGGKSDAVWAAIDRLIVLHKDPVIA